VVSGVLSRSLAPWQGPAVAPSRAPP
jgi:hypothetical protein